MKTILIIEDDATTKETISEILKNFNYKVLNASNGIEGIKLAKENSTIDLIICDIMMPILDGLSVLRILSKEPQTAGTPFIFLSARTDRSDVRKGMELGADDYLTKPFEINELLHTIEIRLRKSEKIKAEISGNSRGLNIFLDDVSELKEFQCLSKQKTKHFYKKATTVYHIGDKPNFLYLLNKGKVKVFRTNPEGKEFITNIYKEGDLFGYQNIFDNNPYSDTCVTSVDSEISKIYKKDFLILIYKNRDVAIQFMKMLSGNILTQGNHLLSLAYDSVRKRSANALLLLQKSSNNSSNLINSNRSDLAQIAGTSPETFTRCLKDFKEDKFIEVNGKAIKLINIPGLESIQ